MKIMKRILIISIPFIMITTAFSKDTLYLKCNVTSDFLITDLTTSQVVDDRSIDDTSILKIDLKASTAHDTRSEEAIDIVIKRKVALIEQRIDDDEMKMNDNGSLHLIPPYPLSGVAKGVYKPKNQKVNATYQGSCIEVDASVLDKALNQQNI